MACWQEAERNAQGLWTIIEPTVPEGQVIVSTALTGTGPVTRMATFAAAPVPERILSWWKGRAILELRGLSVGVQGAIDAMTDPAEKKVAQAAYDGADFLRSSPTLNAVLTALGLSQAEIDELFDAGEALST